jgi:two-component system, LytTR family, response regulator
VIRTLVVDDEPLVRRAITRFLARQEDVALIGEAGDGAAALDTIRAQRPDLVFLDVQMPELTGFEVLAQLPPSQLPAVIFVTAFDEFAIEAFEVHAVDYLLKPFDDRRLFTALDRGRARLRMGPPDTALSDLLAATQATLERFVVRSPGRISFVDAGEVQWIEAANNYVRLHTGGRSHLVRDTVKRLEHRLASDFIRIHRSVLVRTDLVHEVRALHNGDCDVVLKDGTRLRMSRGYREAFERRMVQGP